MPCQGCGGTREQPALPTAPRVTPKDRRQAPHTAAHRASRCYRTRLAERTNTFASLMPFSGERGGAAGSSPGGSHRAARGSGHRTAQHRPLRTRGHPRASAGPERRLLTRGVRGRVPRPPPALRGASARSPAPSPSSFTLLLPCCPLPAHGVGWKRRACTRGAAFATERNRGSLEEIRNKRRQKGTATHPCQHSGGG